MAGETMGPVTLESAKAALGDAIHTSGAFDRSKGIFNIDNFWARPFGQPFIDAFAEYIRASTEFSDAQSVVSFQRFRSDNRYGLSPLVGRIGDALGLQSGVWRESTGSLGVPGFNGSDAERVLLIEDTIGNSELYPALSLIDLKKRGLSPVGLISIVAGDFETDAEDIKRLYRANTGDEIVVKAIFTREELGYVQSNVDTDTSENDSVIVGEQVVFEHAEVSHLLPRRFPRLPWRKNK
ncbi:MAG: hypothetical protein RLZZ455_117 [Candidatus Parcubacteria bacterium]|jgi:hypothetical protein